MKLKGKYALVTGGSEGLGRTITELFLKEGASVMVCARSADRLSQLQKELEPGLAENQQLLTQSADMAQTTQMDRLVKSTLNHFPHLDILVNNAGIYGPKGPLEDCDWSEWDVSIQINLLGPVYMCRALLPHFKKRGYGKIINLSGGGATSPLPRLSAYAASKAGLVRFTETLAEETRGQGIDANAIAPGALNTRLLDEILEAGPEKVGKSFFEKAQKQQNQGGIPLEKGASLCVYLASPESDGITGKLISAVWDPWKDLAQHREDLNKTDIYSLRRIVPEDRGKQWES